MKYRKKPIVIEAVKYNHETDVMSFCGTDNAFMSRLVGGDYCCIIRTLEGSLTAKRGDYIIKGIKGEFYPVKEDIFLASYEKVEE